MTSLARLESVVDDPGAAEVLGAIEAKMPIGVRPRQLALRTLILGILLALSDDRPAHLTRVHRALLALPNAERWRLGVLVRWKREVHELSYRQVERTFSLLVRLLGADGTEGTASELLQALLDRLLEASVPQRWKTPSSLAGRRLVRHRELFPPAARK